MALSRILLTQDIALADLGRYTWDQSHLVGGTVLLLSWWIQPGGGLRHVVLAETEMGFPQRHEPHAPARGQTARHLPVLSSPAPTGSIRLRSSGPHTNHSSSSRSGRRRTEGPARGRSAGEGPSRGDFLKSYERAALLLSGLLPDPHRTPGLCRNLLLLRATSQDWLGQGRVCWACTLMTELPLGAGCVSKRKSPGENPTVTGRGQSKWWTAQALLQTDWFSVLALLLTAVRLWAGRSASLNFSPWP